VKILIISLEEYKITKFSSSQELLKEGEKQKHCVSTYALKCKNKACQIWSIKGPYKTFHFTVELINGKVAQIKGSRNRSPNNEEYDILFKIYKEMNWKPEYVEMKRARV
tara:strand:- start:182 stop:508 length:327 start_codon:yes stop_codon:yes gene_type:complete